MVINSLYSLRRNLPELVWCWKLAFSVGSAAAVAGNYSMEDIEPALVAFGGSFRDGSLAATKIVLGARRRPSC